MPRRLRPCLPLHKAPSFISLKSTAYAFFQGGKCALFSVWVNKQLSTLARRCRLLSIFQSVTLRFSPAAAAPGQRRRLGADQLLGEAQTGDLFPATSPGTSPDPPRSRPEVSPHLPRKGEGARGDVDRSVRTGKDGSKEEEGGAEGHAEARRAPTSPCAARR